MTSVDAVSQVGPKDGPSIEPPHTPSAKETNAAWKTAQEFEGLLMGQLFEAMFAGVDTNGMFGGGQGERIWRSFFLEHVSDSAAHAGGLGLADAIYRDIQGTAAPSPAPSSHPTHRWLR